MRLIAMDIAYAQIFLYYIDIPHIVMYYIAVDMTW
jgi:hypothetical protein